MTLAIALCAAMILIAIEGACRVRRARIAAEHAHQAELEHAAIEAKYLTPRMTEAEIAEMHAVRWQGD